VTLGKLSVFDAIPNEVRNINPTFSPKSLIFSKGVNIPKRSSYSQKELIFSKGVNILRSNSLFIL
jgi:hypothetical protein